MSVLVQRIYWAAPAGVTFGLLSHVHRAAVLDQRGCGSCWASSASAALSGRACMQDPSAFDIQDGIGDWPGRYDRSAYGVSYEAVDAAIWNLRPQRPTIEVARPEIGLSGIEM